MSIVIGLEPVIETKFIDPGALEIEGFDGCNGFSGGYFLEGDRIRATVLSRSLVRCGDLQGHSELIKDILQDSAWVVDGDQLTLTADDGVSVALQRKQDSPLIGPWRLLEIDDRSADAEVVLTLYPRRFSVYSGCRADGDAEVSGTEVSFEAAASIRAGTTTILDAAGEPVLPEPVPPLFDCPSPATSEGQAVHGLDGARGELDGSNLVITTESGSVMTFQLP